MTEKPVVNEPPTRAERVEYGKKARSSVSFDALAECSSGSDRDPVALLEGQAATRVPDLVPIRHGRMAASPFAFYRGGALVMADDLSRTPNSGLMTQLCGDAHLINFGLYATPERKLVFDLNDFDETFPGPFEWDVKRLAASLAVAAGNSDFGRKKRKKIVGACAAEYRETMIGLSECAELDVWYAHIDAQAQLDQIRGLLDSTTRKRLEKTIDKSWNRNSMQALSKLTTIIDGHPRIVSTPPLIVPIEELVAGIDAHALNRELIERFGSYRDTLAPSVRVLFDRFQFVEAARKVVGVGSVGTRTWMVLLRGPGEDPLFLQVKEAQRSVLEAYVDEPPCANQGERVVAGQRLMQAASDIFLGWQRGVGVDGVERDFYVRQLRDGKGSADIGTMSPKMMKLYGRLCARVLAHAHARGGDRFAIAGYLGSDNDFDRAIHAFAETYAEQNGRDHASLLQAISDGRITAQGGV